MEERQLMKKPKEQLEKGKRGLLQIVFGRTGIIIILCLIQLGILAFFFNFLSEHVFAAYWTTVLLGFALVAGIIGEGGNPEFHIAWIVPILIVPVFGALFYLYFHTQVDGRKMNKLVVAETNATADLAALNKEITDSLREESVQMSNLVSYVTKVCKTGVHRNTTAKYFASGEEFLEPFLEELKKARKFIFIEYFIISGGYMLDSVLEILLAKVKEGVEVRFLYDGTNELFRIPKDYPKKLEADGIKCRVFAPIIPVLSTVQNNRDHRKIVVIDGKTAFTGGLNLADEYINRKERFGYWKDCAIMLKGDAVRSFTLMFLRMWEVVSYYPQKGSLKVNKEHYRKYLTAEQTQEVMESEDEAAADENGYVIPYDDNPLDSEQVGELVYMDILNTAKKYVHIMTPYLVLDREMIVALSYAAKRGVDVKIIMPHIPDKKYAFLLARTYYNQLLDAGVEIYEFIPGFVHTKSMVSDDEKAAVGSINLDFRSFYLSFECAALLYKNKEILTMEEDFQKTLFQCVRVTKDVYNKQPFLNKIYGKVLRLFAPMM
ncbi:MAG: cardiolipin synthase [Eubacteriales bacterium]|nr:cardiolipin synthase [Eubacteriales bacterium]